MHAMRYMHKVWGIGWSYKIAFVTDTLCRNVPVVEDKQFPFENKGQKKGCKADTCQKQKGSSLKLSVFFGG